MSRLVGVVIIVLCAFAMYCAVTRSPKMTIEYISANGEVRRFAATVDGEVNTGNSLVDAEIADCIRFYSGRGMINGGNKPKFFVSEWNTGLEIFIIWPDFCEMLEYSKSDVD